MTKRNTAKPVRVVSPIMEEQETSASTLQECCLFRNGSFNDCRFSSVAFDSCDLVEADFSHAPLRGIDLRTSRISGITLNTSDLKGAIITSLQAMDLLPLLGVIIED